MDARIAVIGGVGFNLEGPSDMIETPYGSVKSNRQGSKARRQSSLRVMERTTFHPTK